MNELIGYFKNTYSFKFLVFLFIGYVGFMLWALSYSKRCFADAYSECVNANSAMEVWTTIGMATLIPLLILIVLGLVWLSHETSKEVE